ncbi:MAG: hypothetical protein M1828_006985 [Chrysothrix sp. TS-e1954]|nr:MAG: hypothetical protein M1828_006985 [Chrysothrix sp. TS-e1954]
MIQVDATFVATVFLDRSSSNASIDDTVTPFIDQLKTSKLIEHSQKPTYRLLTQKDFPRVIEVTFHSSCPIEHVRRPEFIVQAESICNAQILIQPGRVGRPPSLRLAVFDMDSTLIQQEVIDLLAAQAGVEAAVSNITSRAMNGELDFSESLRERVALLNGIPGSVFEELKPKLTFVPGAQRLLKCLKTLGVKTAVLSGGFMPLATYVATSLGIDHVHANELAVEKDALTGKLVPGCVIVNAERKRELLQQIAKIESINDNAQIMAVGDGANDLLMLAEAGLGIAVNAKPKVQLMAPCKLNCKSIDDILYVLGLTEAEIDALG